MGAHACRAAPAPALARRRPPAVNQALLCTALGLPPAFFRRFSQSNAAFTVIDFTPAADGKGPPTARVERVNQARPARAARPAAPPSCRACAAHAVRLARHGGAGGAGRRQAAERGAARPSHSIRPTTELSAHMVPARAARRSSRTAP